MTPHVRHWLHLAQTSIKHVQNINATIYAVWYADVNRRTLADAPLRASRREQSAHIAGHHVFDNR
jgi:hypothetical protein